MSPEMTSDSEEAVVLRKQIATARTLLVVVAVATLVSAALLLPQLHAGYFLANIIGTAVVGVLYLGLAVWSRKRPFSAIVAGLLLLLLVVLIDIFFNPFGSFSRWQSKTLSLLLLLLAFPDSRDAQRKMKSAPPGQATQRQGLESPTR
jgi:peptidoglycan/LPS O-acetylase OafA/YrhL